MLRTIQRIIPIGNAKIPTDWNKFISDTKSRIDTYRIRFDLTHPNYTPLLNILSAILNQVDHTVLLNMDTGYKRFNEIVKHTDTIERLFDPLYTGVSDNNPFVENHGDTINYCLRTKVSNPLLNLPIGSGWEAWETVKPLRVLYHDSPELLYDFCSTSIAFKHSPPQVCVLSLDIVQFIMKYLAYAEYKEIVGYTSSEFIMHHVLDALHEDMVAQWLLNLISDTMELSTPTEEIASQQSHGIVAQRSIYAGVAEARKYMEYVKFGKISVTDFLNTPWISGKSYIQLMIERQTLLRCIDVKASTHLQFISEYHLIHTVVTLCSLYETRVSKQVYREIKRALLRYNRMGVFSSIKNPRFKDIVLSKLQSLENTVRI